jgi:ABC-type glycerol-3-phosphate transport system substrate-binding protein
LWGLQYDPHVETYNRLADLFKEKSEITLTVAPQNTPIETKLIAALAAGTQPDVVCILSKTCVPLFFRDALLPVDDLYAEMGVTPDDYYTDGSEALTYNGKIHGVNMEFGAIGYPVNVPVDEVEKLGLQDLYPPTNGEFWFESFDQMWALAEALMIKDADGRVARWGLSSKGWDSGNYLMILRSLLLPKGSDWWDLAQTKFMVDTEEGVEAMRLMAETPVKMGIETELDQTHVDACLAGKVAIGRGNGTPALQINQDLGYHFELAGSPLLDGEIMTGVSEAGWAFVVPRAAKNVDVGREFIKMMLTEEGAIEYAKIYGGIPSTRKSLAGRRDWFADQDPTTPLNRYMVILEEQIAPNVRYYGEQFGYASEVDAIFAAICSEVRLQNMTAEEACAEAQARLDAQYAQYLNDVQQAQA